MKKPGWFLIQNSTMYDTRHVPKGGQGAHAPPDFGRSEGAAGQGQRAALLPAPSDF